MFASLFHLFVSTSIIIVIDEYSNVGVEVMMILLFVDFSSHFGHPEANRTRFTEDALGDLQLSLIYRQKHAPVTHSTSGSHLYTDVLITLSTQAVSPLRLISRSAVSAYKVPLS